MPKGLLTAGVAGGIVRTFKSQLRGGNFMDSLAWIEMAVLWGFAALVIVLDRKNWDK